jgi:outer membrane cobalamin receptor
MLSIFVLALFSVSSGVTMAQAQDSVKPKELQKVSVIAPRTGKEIVSGQKMQGKDLARLNSLSVADALRFFAGLQVKDYGGIGGLKTVDVRSMGTNQTGVFYDGIQLGNAQNGQIDLGKFSLDNMQEIALYNGQKSNIFQPAKDFSAAGAIYMTSLKPSFKLEEHTHLKATVKTGSFGLFDPSVLWQQKINDKISGSFNAEWIHANGRYKFRSQKENGYDTTLVRKNGDVNSYRLEGGMNGIMNGGEWNTKLYYYQSARGLPGYIANNIYRHVDRQWDRDFFIQSSYRKDVTSRYSLLVNAKYAYDYTRYRAPDTAFLPVDNHYRQKEAYLSIAQQYTLKHWWSTTISADFQWNKLDADLQDFAYPTRYTTLVAAASAVYFKRFSAQGSLLATIVNETVEKKTAATPKREYTPAVYLSWQPFTTPSFKLRGFYKRIFRMPTFNDLYYTDIGNSLLKPEYATQYDAGVTWTHAFTGKILQQAGVETDVYYNEVSQKIVAIPTVNQFRWTMMNLGFVEIRGIDVKAKGNWLVGAVNITTRLTYTYQKAQDYTDPTSSYYKNQIVYIPWHSGSLVVGADYTLWTANYSLLYTGERYDGANNIPENYMQPWYTSDFSLGRAFTYKRLHIHLTGQVNNLFNQFYDVVLNYPMPGRNYKLITTVNIK